MGSEFFDWSIFDGYDNDFVPKQQGFRDTIDRLPDGSYDMEVADAAFDTIKGDPVFRVGVRPLGGAVFEWLHWLNSPDKVNSLGADLCVLGVPADRWKPEGKKLRDELPRVPAQIVGVKFKASKVTDRPKEGAYAGREFHKLKLIARIGGNPMPQTAPFPAATPANGAAPQLAPSDLPF